VNTSVLSRTTSIFNPDRRWRVMSTISAEVKARTELQAQLQLNLDMVGDVIDWHTVASSAEEIVYQPPGISEQWARAAAAIRLGESLSCGMLCVEIGDVPGAWWASNGHVLLRCDGPSPPEFRPQAIRKQTLRGLLSPDDPRPADLLPRLETMEDGDHKLLFAASNGNLFDAEYILLAEASAPACWRVSGEVAIAYDAQGRQLAFVMRRVARETSDVSPALDAAVEVLVRRVRNWRAELEQVSA